MKQLLVMFMLLCSTAIFAQDVIVKKDGSTILAKVLEVNTDNIRYKKHSNLNGPTYTIGKSEIMSINYENGEKEVFKEGLMNHRDRFLILTHLHMGISPSPNDNFENIRDKQTDIQNELNENIHDKKGK